MSKQNKTDSKSLTQKLCIVWLISFLAVGKLTSSYLVTQKRLTGVSPLDNFGGYQVFVISIIVLYFVPLLLSVQRYAKQAKMAKIVIASRLLLLHHALWLVAVMLETIKTFF